MTMSERKPRKMPKGGRKGGSVFPRVALSDALLYARKLVSKTHTRPQPKDVILSGVVGAKSGVGEVRMSAIKQYGFLNGDMKSGFSADELAKKIIAATSDELLPLYQRAALKPTVFKNIFDTYHGDTVPKAKIKKRAADLKVHPDETETCADLYVSSMVTAGLVVVDGDRLTHKAASELAKPISPDNVLEQADEENAAEAGLKDQENTDEASADGVNEGEASKATLSDIPPLVVRPQGPRAIFNVNVTLDSSLDIEKLQRQLELLKHFGAI